MSSASDVAAGFSISGLLDAGAKTRSKYPVAELDIDAIEADPNRGFVISPRKASLHHTMGGVKIDSEAHVLNANGEAISGLWAAGEVTGGVHAGNRLGGNAEADIFTFGRIAGVNAAANQ